MTPVFEQLLEQKPAPSVNADLTVADAVWVGTALLHQKAGNDNPISTEEITEYVDSLHLTKGVRKSIWQHVNQHCVANRKPQPNRARMLFATGGGYRRLFRNGDPFDPEREGGRTYPAWQDLPAQYAGLREWFGEVWNAAPIRHTEDPLLALAGSGSGLWDGLLPDEYVTSLRSGWSASS